MFQYIVLMWNVFTAEYKIVCYLESWSSKRPQPLDFSSGDIDPFSCTHVIYAFAGLNEGNYSIESLDPDYDIVTGKIYIYCGDCVEIILYK